MTDFEGVDVVYLKPTAPDGVGESVEGHVDFHAWSSNNAYRTKNNLAVFPGRDPETLNRRTALELLSGLGEVLYAVQFPDGTIKIGWSAAMATRVYGYPEATIIGFKFGSRNDELAIHHQLSAHCARGREWYHPHPDVLEVVNEWREALGREPLSVAS